MTPQPFHSSNRVRATSLAGASPRLVVSFTGIGKADRKEQVEEFVAGSSMNGENHVLFVADTLRSWYNEPGMYEEILDLVETYKRAHRIEEVVTFGNSMGGYGAMIFAGDLGATSCLSLSAQYSADPDVVPEEARWMEYRERIQEFTRPPMEETLSEDCTYFVVHGGSRLEQPHWSRFPQAPNMQHYLADRVGHALGKKMKQAGKIRAVTKYAILARPVAFRRTLNEVFERLTQVKSETAPRPAPGGFERLERVSVG
ncbi:MAG: hypothetical protein AAFZ04_14335 [Pseudomonadota bacterium]